jgi:AmpD protein
MNPTSDFPGALDCAGWLAGAEPIPSPNYDARPSGSSPILLVVHAISLPPGEFDGDAIVRLFTNRLDAAEHPYFANIASHRVSAHFLIRRDGRLIQFVSCYARAWHAGLSCWRGRQRCNDFSLGVELEGDDFSPFSTAQYVTLHGLIEALQRDFSLQACVGHADIAPGRKTDPGPYFDWSRLQCCNGA